MPFQINREVDDLPYPHNLLCRLGCPLKNKCYPSGRFLEAFEYELMLADMNMNKLNYSMMMMYYRQGFCLAEIGSVYHISRQAVQIRIQKMIGRISHPTRIKRIEEIVHEENLKIERAERRKERKCKQQAKETQ